MVLDKQLEEKKKEIDGLLPKEILDAINGHPDELKREGIVQQALKEGDTLPDFILNNTEDKPLSLDEIEGDYLIVSFTRGNWCPYCNIELKTLQQFVNRFTELKSSLVVISPEVKEKSKGIKIKSNLTFPILHDVENKYAKSLGLVYNIPEALNKTYQILNVSLSENQGYDSTELPLPATYVVRKKDVKIIHAYINEEPNMRLNPLKILSIIVDDSM